MKPRRGFTQVAGKEKLGVGQFPRVLDKMLLCNVEETGRESEAQATGRGFPERKFPS